MRLILLMMIGIFIAQLCTAQLQVNKIETKENLVGRSKNSGYLGAEITYITSGADTAYSFLYSNNKYTTLTDYQSISFIGKESLDGFYEILKSMFTDDHKDNKEYKVSFTLGKTDVIVSPVKTFNKYAAFIWTSRGYTRLTEKQIDEVFGKN